MDADPGYDLAPPPPELLGIIAAAVQSAGRARQSQFELLPPSPRSVVMLGDSITEGGLWNEWFPGLPIVNRGISGDTIDGLEARLGAALIEPSVVAVLIGTNDVAPLGSVADPEAVAEAFEQLLGHVLQQSPNARVIVQSVMPRTPDLVSVLTELNTCYRASAERHGATYLDLWPSLAGNRGELRREFTRDGLHLTGVGYRTWVETLRPVLTL